MGSTGSEYPAAGMPDFSYDAMGGPANTAAAYGSFEEEAPLLEGARRPFLSHMGHVHSLSSALHCIAGPCTVPAQSGPGTDTYVPCYAASLAKSMVSLLVLLVAPASLTGGLEG